MKKIKHLINWKLYRLLFGLAVIGIVCIFPYALTLQGETLQELPLSLPTIIALSMLQSTVMVAIALFLGLILAKKTQLGAPLLEEYLKGNPIRRELTKRGYQSLQLGILAALIIIGGDYLFSLLEATVPGVSAPIWQGFLASFYGAIVEEILLRLFFMSFLVWLFSKFTKALIATWGAIILSSLLFGLAHLPATQLLVELTPLIILRAIILNGIGGVIFGWLYWKKGLLSAMIAHFSADIVLHVLFPLVLLMT